MRKLWNVVPPAKFTFDSRKAELIRDSLQVYYFAKGLARRTRNPELEAHIAALRALNDPLTNGDELQVGRFKLVFIAGER